jgi:uncharacterized damage-inducible protein DinB
VQKNIADLRSTFIRSVQIAHSTQTVRSAIYQRHLLIAPMKKAFLLQYGLLQNCRSVLFEFLEAQIENNLETPIINYSGQSIAGLMRHVAACYMNWLGYFGMQMPEGLLGEVTASSSTGLRELYERVDTLVYHFIDQADVDMDVPIAGIHDAVGAVSATSAQLFTHVFSHEFHHRGQVLNMCRILGYVPPDTDVSLFFPIKL